MGLNSAGIPFGSNMDHRAEEILPSTATVTRERVRWWDTLSFRLALIVNMTVVAVLATFGVLDYHRERDVHLSGVVDRLREEAKILLVARSHISDGEGFRRFVDDFCRQMSTAASPGHHIAVFGPDQAVVMRAHERADPGLETAMAATARTGATSFSYNGLSYVSVSVAGSDGERVAIAQSTEPIEAFLHAQRNSSIVSTGILVTLIFGVTTIGLLIWVRTPLRNLVAGVHALGQRRFDTRVRAAGKSELRFLARGINTMAGALERVEKLRRREMASARVIQQSLLPPDIRVTDHLAIAAVFLPADDVGGDLYDVIELQDGSTLIAVLDVSGHGVPAALCTALLRTVLRHEAGATVDTVRIAEAMNSEFADIGVSGAFATCFLARLVNSSGDIEYVSAGHEPGVLIRADSSIELLEDHGLPLGVDGGSTYRSFHASLNQDDRLFLFTDGLHEVFDEQETQFGRERLRQALAGTSKLPVDRQLRVIIEKVRSFQCQDRFSDDVTLLCAHRK